MRDRKGELGQFHEGRDPVSVCPAVFGLCALASLSLLFRLKGLLYHGANLLLQIVVVVGRELVIALPVFGGRPMDVGLGVGFGQSEQRPTPHQIVAIVLRSRFEYPADLAQHRVLPFESSGYCPRRGLLRPSR